MNYWLVKSEPDSYSWDDLFKDKSTVWSGVRNYTARNNLKLMKKGDLVFYYHSNDGKDIVGIAEVSKEAFPDPTIKDERWVAVELIPNVKLKKSVSLEDIKSNKHLSEMELVKLSRLSVQKVSEGDFKTILMLSDTVL